MDWEQDGQGSDGTLYSRALFGDLCPDALSPLTATAGVGAELDAAWSQAYRNAGFDPPQAQGPRAVARFGGYLYLDTSRLRELGELVGADPIAFSHQYLGERPDVPRRREQRTHTGTTGSGGAGETGPCAWLEPTLVRTIVARPPELPPRPELPRCTDTELVARIHQLRSPLRRALQGYAHAELGAAVCGELLARLTEQAGHPAYPGALVSGLGGPLGELSERLWTLSRRVVRFPALGRLFDDGIAAVAEQLGTDRGGELGKFRACLRSLLCRCGHVGPAEWELAAPTWGTEPRLVLGLLDALRRGEDWADPAARAAVMAEQSTERVSAVRARVSGAERERFDSALEATRRWLCLRERRRHAVSELHHEQRLAARELGQRHVRSGLLDDVEQIFMLRAGELDAFAEDPDELGDQLRLRGYDYQALTRYQPPFVTVGPPGPLVSWPRRPTGRAGASGRAGARVELTGTVASPGIATGPTRLPSSPADTRALRRGDVLVLPSAGPGWVPLLPIAGAVVTETGGPLSSVAVAARELGIPCVVGVPGATTKLRAGHQVIVDRCQVTG